MKKNKFINCAVIGLGIGEKHLNTLLSIKEAKVVGICDFNKKKLSKIKKKYKKKIGDNCIYTHDYKKILNIFDLDLIIIASYDNFHCKHIIEFSKKKINIFVEKPICQTKQELKIIKKQIKKNNILLGCNFVLRENPIFKNLKSKIKKGEFGKLYHFEGEYNYGRIEKIHNGWRGKIPFYSIHQGGTIHILDLILFFNNSKIKNIFTLSNRISSHKTKFIHQDISTVIMKFFDGSTAKITSNFSSITPHHHKLSVFGTKKTFDYNYTNNIYFSSKDNQKKKINISQNIKKYDKSITLKNFLKNINSKKNNIKSDMKDLFYLMKIILDIDLNMKKTSQT